MDVGIIRLELCGSIAAALQIVGYGVYIRGSILGGIRPNAVSFLMFAYGTSLLAFIEYRDGAAWSVLALPIVCAALSIIVSALCVRCGEVELLDGFDKAAFAIDLGLTLTYLGLALHNGEDGALITPFLIATNLSALVCFIPIIRSTWRMPDRELPAPWLIWSLAYGLLGIEVNLNHAQKDALLLLYPILNLFLHGSVAAISLRLRIARHLYGFIQGSLRIDDSRIDGLGLHAKRYIQRGEVICHLKGKIKIRPRRTYPNWIGIGPKVWIDPCLPLQYINHSCSANSGFGANRVLRALKDIQPGEEITLDYSTTEADPDWAMVCTCDSICCRKNLHAIHISFAESELPPVATPRMTRFWKRMVTSEKPRLLADRHHLAC